MFYRDESFENEYTRFMNEIKDLNRNVYLEMNLKNLLKEKIKNNNTILKLIHKEYLKEIKLESCSNYFSNSKIAIYTSVFGKYDKIFEPISKPDNCDYFIITDQSIDLNSVWKKNNVDLIKLGISNMSNVEKNRYFKMFPHKIFTDYDYSIYIDGNIKVITDLTEFINKMNKEGLKLHLHPKTNCIYKEIGNCRKLNKDTKDNLDKHYKHLMAEKMPKNYGMLEASIIVREHDNKICEKLMEDWWYEFNYYSKRDQISLPYVLWKTGIKVKDIGTLGNNLRYNYAFRRYEHL